MSFTTKKSAPMTKRVPASETANTLGTSRQTIGMASESSTCFSVRLSEEVVRRILTSSSSAKLQLSLSPSGEASLLIDGKENHVLTRTPEAQVVDVVRGSSNGRLIILGQVKEKLAVKQELAYQKMSEIRQVSEEAEKARLSRKTVTLDTQPPSVTKRRKITNPVPLQKGSLPKMNPGIVRRTPASSMPLDLDRSFKLSNGTTSERDSQQSWSPVLPDHGTHGHGATFSLDSYLDRPKASPSGSERKISSSATLLNQRPHGSAMGRKDAKRAQFYELSEQFGRRYQEYLTLSRQVDSRLSIFQKLEKDLAALKTSGADEKSPDQVIFKVVVEQQRLKDDKDYEKTMEELEECYAAMMVIKSRLSALVKS